MANNGKYISRSDSNGSLQVEEAIGTSAGVIDASKIVKTNASGKLDSSLIPSVSGRLVEEFVLSASNITNKKVALSSIPLVATSVTVNTPHGPIQRLDYDYEVIGQEVSRNGYGLETILEEGDILIIIYS